jgi:hypothetical protein
MDRALVIRRAVAAMALGHMGLTMSRASKPFLRTSHLEMSKLTLPLHGTTVLLGVVGGFQ